MSFIEWKKSYLNNRVCKNKKSLSRWLFLRKAKMIPELANQKWVCKARKKLYMIQYTLELNIENFEKKYILHPLSLLSLDDMIHHEYFKIFGNICKITSQSTRLMEYPRGKIVIQKYTIYATVRPLWKEERSSQKINRFFWQYREKKNHKRKNILEKMKNLIMRRVIPPREAKEALTNHLKKTILEKVGADATWSTKEYHQKIIKYFVQHKSINNENPRLVLIFGLPGSGKNWVLEKKRNKDHVMTNVDDCRALLPNYWKNMVECKHAEDEDWIRLFHTECNSIAMDIFNYALNHRMNIVWNGTGKNLAKYKRLIHLAKTKDYIVELRYIWVPLSLARSRVHRRASIIGRIVPEEIIQIAYKKIPETFKNLRVEADYARVFENTVISPTIVWDEDQGWLSSTPRRRKSICDSLFDN